jgi:hypothetical protein
MIHWADQERSSGSITIIDNFGKWPVVESDDDWCGEFEERVAPGESIGDKEYLTCPICEKPMETGTQSTCDSCDSRIHFPGCMVQIGEEGTEFVCKECFNKHYIIEGEEPVK